MSAVESRLLPAYTRRHVLSWAAAAMAFGTTGRLAWVAASNQASPEGATTTFLDANLVHDISIVFAQSDYDAMIEAFVSSGDKEWLEATVSIDDSTYETVGIRLKGNSSLGALGGGSGPSMRAAEPGGASRSGTPEAGKVTQAPVGNMATSETPERLPWLIRLDKYVDGQNHQGVTELVIRSNMSATSLNEAVSLDLLTLAGLASQRAAYAGFTANDREPSLRMTIEHPNDAWMLAHFPEGGLLYKAEAGGDFSYRGDDPEAYTDVFDLEAGGTGDDAADMQPLFDFLAFLNESDDATFAAELPNRLDVDAFATYLAMMNLLENFDDISGPGNNAYLHVGPDRTRFTVVPWDMNLALGGGLERVIPEDGAIPQAPEDLPPGAEVRIVTEGTPVTDPIFDGEGPAGVIPAQPNILVERWNVNPAFTGLVDTARTRLHSELYKSGVASGVLARWVEVLKEHAADMVDADTITTEVAAIAEILAKQP